ncbi:MAG: TldD/PmbA family protein [Marinilabiliaceae bacterium]|nr:TldD/PmbA family protein [Marinilabiliaceae bacterium]
MMKVFGSVVMILMVLTADIVFAAESDDKLLKILNEELKREQNGLKNEKYPPYFISYRIAESKQVFCLGSMGTLIQSDTIHQRILQTNVRIGNYQHDNTRDVQELGVPVGESIQFLTLEDIEEPIKMAIWQSTDQAYTSALDNYQSLLLNKKFEEQDTIPDFIKQDSLNYYEDAVNIESFNFEEWNKKVKKYSELLNQDPNILSGTAQLRFIMDRRYYFSSEGVSIVHNSVKCYLSVNGTINGIDNVPVQLSIQHYAPVPDSLPNEEVIIKQVKDLVSKLNELRNAPYAEPYEGPAILSANASGVFFHEIFGHRIEGQRMRSDHDGQTFKNKIGYSVLPKEFTVISDPTASYFDDLMLSGNYLYDDQGVKSQRVTVVENGILKEFLMSRTPLSQSSRSNGHGRCELGNSPVARQSNLIIQSNEQYSMEKLRKMLIKECKRQKKPYGYYFAEVTGGFTNTSRYNPNAFEVIPVEVYRIYADGSPDELVRGVNLIGTPLAMFAEIEAAGDSYEVFNGFCGAESGSIPVSAVAPALFVKQIETQREPTYKLKPALLSRPDLKQ